jgi:hypothetical protein
VVYNITLSNYFYGFFISIFLCSTCLLIVLFLKDEIDNRK